MHCSQRIVTEQDRRALAAGLPAEVLLVLIGARRLWHQANGPESTNLDNGALNFKLPPSWWQTPELAAAVAHPAAAGWDSIFVAAMRRQIG